jgi:tetratricopeptide (TPR) repeat protein
MLLRLMRMLTRKPAAGAQAPQPVRERAAGDGTNAGVQAATACRRAEQLIERGDLEAAEASLREAIDLQHDCADTHFLLGRVHQQRAEPEDAADCYHLALHFDPRHAGAHHALAALHKAVGRHREAAEHYRGIIEHQPDDAAAHCNLSDVLYELGEYRDARRHAEHAIQVHPRLAEAHHNLGGILRATGEPLKALRCYQRALDLAPLPGIVAGLGHAHRDLGRLDQAIAAYERALRLAPDFGDAITGLAYALLAKEDFRAGWDAYERRSSLPGHAERDFGCPRWHGEPLEGKAVLVYAEQGLGDEIMFASCLPELTARAGRVVIECSARLEGLFRRSFPQATVHGGAKEDATDWVAALPPVDYQVAVGSLPRTFRASKDAFPAHNGYLRADPDRVRAWRTRLASAGGGRLAVGISWHGGTHRTRGHLRSVPLDELVPLLRPEWTFISLQHDAAALGAERRPAIRLFPGVTGDLDELAALICALDIVVSVDNTNVHLAGALGRPVFALLSASPDWRYGLSGETMPWYPSARLFRQGGDRHWQPVVEQLGVALAECARHAGRRDS